jgi:hypothetical protein
MGGEHILDSFCNITSHHMDTIPIDMYTPAMASIVEIDTTSTEPIPAIPVMVDDVVMAFTTESMLPPSDDVPTSPSPIKAISDTMPSLGYTVFKDVVDPEPYKEKLLTWMDTITDGIEGVDTPDAAHGIFKHFGIGHCDALVDARKEVGVRKPFADLYGVPESELVSSFDGACYLSARKIPAKSWMHLDQDSRISDFDTAQSLVALTDSDETRGGLVVMERSHKHHKAFFEAFPDMTVKTSKDPKEKKPNRNYVKLRPEHETWYAARGCTPTVVPCDAGDLVMWDSRTVHCNKAPSTGEDPRMCMYVSMGPKSRRHPKYAEKMAKYKEERRTTSHSYWKSTVNSKLPDSRGDPVVKARTLKMQANAETYAKGRRVRRRVCLK